MAFILGVFVGVAYFLAYESDVTTLYNHLNFICFDVYFKTIFESSGTYLNSVLSKNLMFLERTSNTSFFGLELLLRPSAIYNVFMYLFLFRAIDYKSLSSLFFYKTFLTLSFMRIEIAPNSSVACLCVMFLFLECLAFAFLLLLPQPQPFSASSWILSSRPYYFLPVFASVFINSIFIFLLLPEFS